MLNGGLQLSVLDGWWAEAYDWTNGWAIETPVEASTGDQDAHDSQALYDLLETQVVPLFYNQDAGDDMPRGWVRMIKASMKSLAPRFNATRMVNEYVAASLKY